MHGLLRLPDRAFANAAPVEVITGALRGRLQRLLERLRGAARLSAALTDEQTPDDELLAFRQAELEARLRFDEAMEAWAGRD